MRTIDWDAPLSEDDIAWCLDRDMHDKVKANQDRFSGEADDEPPVVVVDNDNPPAELEDDYDSWKVAELREEAGKRNPVVDVEGLKKDEIITALRAWDAANPE